MGFPVKTFSVYKKLMKGNLCEPLDGVSENAPDSGFLPLLSGAGSGSVHDCPLPCACRSSRDQGGARCPAQGSHSGKVSKAAMRGWSLSEGKACWSCSLDLIGSSSPCAQPSPQPPAAVVPSPCCQPGPLLSSYFQEGPEAQAGTKGERAAFSPLSTLDRSLNHSAPQCVK